MFEKALAGKERLMVYTKKDLAEGTLDKTVGWYLTVHVYRGLGLGQMAIADTRGLLCCRRKLQYGNGTHRIRSYSPTSTTRGMSRR